jgi:hypothetical protein
VRELFVWYRVRDDRAAEALAAVQAMQGALASAWPGLRPRVLTRTDGAGVQTWMEAYAFETVDPSGSGVGIDRAIERAIESAAQPLAVLIEGARHMEAFATTAAR